MSDAQPSAESTRAADLADGLETVRARIERAATAAGRDPAEVVLVVVTKFFPVSDVRVLHELGVRDVGENRHQEAEAKAAELADLEDLRWHFVGSLQSNKAAAVARYADVVHSVDRAKLLSGLDRGAAERERPLDLTLQVSLDPDPGARGRGGVSPEQLPDLVAAVAGHEWLRLRGVMGVAPPDEDPADAFARLARCAQELRENHPGADWVSAGMTGDLEPAIAAGATHVRVGSGILGPRPPRR